MNTRVNQFYYKYTKKKSLKETWKSIRFYTTLSELRGDFFGGEGPGTYLLYAVTRLVLTTTGTSLDKRVKFWETRGLHNLLQTCTNSCKTWTCPFLFADC